MKASEKLAQELSQRGFRRTRARQGVLEVLTGADGPLSVRAIREELTKRGVEADRATVYRELEFLKKEDVAHETRLGDGTNRYEIAQGHHHHLVCTDCEDVVDVSVDEKRCERFMKDVMAERAFNIREHETAFYGQCLDCARR